MFFSSFSIKLSAMHYFYLHMQIKVVHGNIKGAKKNKSNRLDRSDRTDKFDRTDGTDGINKSDEKDRIN